MSVLMTLPRSAGWRRGNRPLMTAFHRDSPRIRWAAQSAEIALQLIPHTFSV